MSNVLVDTSVWIAYFRGDAKTEILTELIETNRVRVNELILTELLPSIVFKKEYELAGLLDTVIKLPLTIKWGQIREYQITNFKNGINKVGIADLIIFQNAIANNTVLFTLDKHFHLMANYFECRMFILK